MKLFSVDQPLKEKSAKSAPVGGRKMQQMAVISPRDDVRQEIVSRLKMHNIEKISEHNIDFFSLQDNSFTQEVDAVIVDIGSCTDLVLINQTLAICIPAEVFYLLVGSHDSISFAQQLVHNSGGYLHLESQLEQLTNRLLLAQQQSQHHYNAVKISILGCKGGVGTSTIAWQLFSLISSLTAVPLLLVQGASGSSDLDLLMETNLPKDGTIHMLDQQRAVVMELPEECWNYSTPLFNRYNLVLFDHDIHAQPHEKYEDLLNLSDIVVLVLSRELSAVRLAKNILEENRRFALVQQEREKRILLCLNENHPPCGNELKNSDIEEYLGCPVKMILPYQTAGFKPAAPGSPLYTFAADILGKSVRNNGGKRPWFFTGLLKRNKNKAG